MKLITGDQICALLRKFFGELYIVKISAHIFFWEKVALKDNKKATIK